MPKVTCPFCEKEVEISGDYFPELACDTTLANCPSCESEIELGWYANFEASRPTPRAADTCPVCGGDGIQVSGVRGARKCIPCDGTGKCR